MTTRLVHGKDVDVPVDLIVPNDLASTTGRRGARLGPHGRVAARKILGLEAAIFDNDELDIEGLGDDGRRVVRAKVAGPTALLIAKAHKIQERIQNSERLDRVIDKDAGDAYRLMQTSDAEECANVAVRLMKHTHAGGSAGSGIRFLVEQFRAPASRGTTMAVNYYRGAVPAERVQSICTQFVARLALLLPQRDTTS